MAAPLYRAARPDVLRIAPLDALTLIFHRSSGITHVVDTPVPEILETLGDAELDVATLLDRLRAAYELGDADPQALAARLDELVDAGLAERR